MSSDKERTPGIKKPNSLSLFVLVFVAQFMAFMIWYFILCDNNAIVPSDWALMAIMVFCSVELIICGWIQVTKSKASLTDKQKEQMTWAGEALAAGVSKFLDIEAPMKRSSVQGYKEVPDDETTNEGEIYG